LVTSIIAGATGVSEFQSEKPRRKILPNLSGYAQRLARKFVLVDCRRLRAVENFSDFIKVDCHGDVSPQLQEKMVR